MELISQLDAIGVKATPDDEDDGEAGSWEDVGDSDEDVEME